MPLDRTWYNTLVDDSGSGLDGTIWNKAAVDALMDDIDAAALFAGVRQIVGATASGNFSTTSATNVSVTNAAITITTGASATIAVFCVVPVRVSGGQALFDWSVDTVDDGNVQGVITSATDTTLTMCRFGSGFSAAAHTFQLRVRSSAAGTVAVDMSSVAIGRLIAVEFR